MAFKNLVPFIKCLNKINDILVWHYFSLADLNKWTKFKDN